MYVCVSILIRIYMCVCACTNVQTRACMGIHTYTAIDTTIDVTSKQTIKNSI